MKLPRDLRNYLLWQLPGWVAAGLVLLWLHALVGLPAWAAWLLFGLYVAKDFVLFPALRGSFRPPAGERMVGARGWVVEPLSPRGYVRLGSELWKAEAWPSGRTLAEGSPVVVREVRGLTLLVEEERVER